MQEAQDADRDDDELADNAAQIVGGAGPGGEGVDDGAELVMDGEAAGECVWVTISAVHYLLWVVFWGW